MWPTKEAAMQSIQENMIVDLILNCPKKIHFIEGLGGFEQIKDFELTINPLEAPLIWLTALHDPNMSFLTVDPFLVYSDYSPEFLDEDLEALGIEHAEKMCVLCLATINKKPEFRFSVNLKAPLVINWETNQGKQLIVINHKTYSMEHKLIPNPA
jgi:flagellar assembly factor FliW